MFNQYFYSYSNQNQAPNDLDFVFKEMTKSLTDIHPYKRECKCYDTRVVIQISLFQRQNILLLKQIWLFPNQIGLFPKQIGLTPKLNTPLVFYPPDAYEASWNG